MEVIIEKRVDLPQTEITIIVRDDYIAGCTPDPHAHLYRAMSKEDQIGMITDAVHSVMGVLPNQPKGE